MFKVNCADMSEMFVFKKYHIYLKLNQILQLVNITSEMKKSKDNYCRRKDKEKREIHKLDKKILKDNCFVFFLIKKKNYGEMHFIK